MAGKKKTRVLALANQKGGVGKTTTAVNLGAELAAMGERVLIVDIDPQANATIGLGCEPNSLKFTIYDVLLNPNMPMLLQPSSDGGSAVVNISPGLDLIPSTIDLAAAELELSGAIGRETLLRDALAPIIGRYTYILIDPPPSLGLFTLNALAAAHEVLLPLQVQIYALKGVAQLEATISLVRQKLNPKLAITGVVCTMVDNRNNLSGQVEAAIRQKYGDKVYKTTIPVNVQLAEAPGAGQPISEYDSSSKGAVAYHALAEEVRSNGKA
jgi:chromosome partitioning protein